MINTGPKIVFGITGAGGAIYGISLLRKLVERGCEISLVVSEPARRVIREELFFDFNPAKPEWDKILPGEDVDKIHVYDNTDIGSPPASGSNLFQAYVICPCSMGTLARVAAGVSDNLITRMADVALKERRRLVLVPRETPLSTIHLRNMLTLSEAGTVILPACPGFYQRPGSIDDLVGFVVERVIGHLGL